MWFSFFDKYNDKINFSSPASKSKIIRGEKEEF